MRRAKLIQIDIPIVGENISEGEIPADLPGLEFEADEQLGNLTLQIEIETGRIQDWPSDRLSKTEVHLHIDDRGTYSLLDQHGDLILSRTGYVPNLVVPGAWGDEIDLLINEDGLIENWPEAPDLSEFKQE